MLHPLVSTRLAAEHRHEMIERARKHQLRRDTAIRASMARARAPARVPWHWRWRYR